MELNERVVTEMSLVFGVHGLWRRKWHPMKYYLKVFNNFVVATITRLYYHRSLSVVI